MGKKIDCSSVEYKFLINQINFTVNLLETKISMLNFISGISDNVDKTSKKEFRRVIAFAKKNEEYERIFVDFYKILKNKIWRDIGFAVFIMKMCVSFLSVIVFIVKLFKHREKYDAYSRVLLTKKIRNTEIYKTKIVSKALSFA
jgi:hypothetical protein